MSELFTTTGKLASEIVRQPELLDRCELALLTVVQFVIKLAGRQGSGVARRKRVLHRRSVAQLEKLEAEAAKLKSEARKAEAEARIVELKAERKARMLAAVERAEERVRSDEGRDGPKRLFPDNANDGPKRLMQAEAERRLEVALARLQARGGSVVIDSGGEAMPA